MKLQFSISPRDPLQTIAPPLPPMVSVTITTPAGTVPVQLPTAWLSSNEQFIIVPLIPFQYAAPPLRHAVLLINIELVNLPS